MRGRRDGPERSVADVARRRVVIEGKVQGVGYRGACARRAIAAGVSGWIRNLDDGRVEAVFEGPPAAVEGLLTWSRRGPVLARVRDVQIVEEPPANETGFRVE